MSKIKLSEDDPIVSRAKALKTFSLNEVGYISGDECGCKFYGQQYANGGFRIVGMHSKTYGCPIVETVVVEIVPSPLRR